MVSVRESMYSWVDLHQKIKQALRVACAERVTMYINRTMSGLIPNLDDILPSVTEVGVWDEDL